MTGLGHHIVEAGWQRLAGVFKPARKARSSALTFRPAPRAMSDAQALTRAHNLYAGEETLSTEQFLSLEWLNSFANSGRQLLMSHALRLLEGWHTQAIPLRALEAEAQVLRDLSTGAANFATSLQTDQLQSLVRVFTEQLKRLTSIRTRTPHDHLTKAFALLSAARAVQDGSQLQQDALRLLDQAMPQLVASDGGPLSHALSDYLRWISPLLLEQDLTFSPNTRNALDRARPFLAMLLDAEKNYCLSSAPVPVAEVLNTAALRLAATSQVARLAAARTVAIAVPAQLTGNTSLNISSQGRALLQASLFLHDGNEDQSVKVLSNTENEQGQLLIQETQSTSRMAFLSASGADLRMEDQWPKDDLKRWMRLDLCEGAKVSIARNGTQATIALDSRNLWQLTLRGATLLPFREDNVLIAETRKDRINWALKRILRPSAKQGKSAELELPF
jgi:hypothetical protein